MDVGDPSNFARIYDLYEYDHSSIKALVSGATYSDESIKETIAECYKTTGYILDPHGACGYQALKDLLKERETGVFCETAHPAKFKDTVEPVIGCEIKIPSRLAAFMRGEKRSIVMPKEFSAFKEFLMSR